MSERRLVGKKMFDTNFLFGSLSVTLFLGVISFALLWWSSVRHHGYWKKRGVVCANTVPILGSLYEAKNKTISDIENERYQKLGRIYGYYEANAPLLSVGEPALLRDIFVKDFGYFQSRRVFDFGVKLIDDMLTTVKGEDWKRIRSIVSPTFSTGKIKRMMNIFKESSHTLCQNFKAAAGGGSYVDTRSFYEALAMDVIASSAFSTKIDSHNDPKNEFVQMAKKTFTGGFSWKFVLFFICPKLVRALKIDILDKEAMDFFIKVTHQIVEERRRSGKSRNDFLQLLMDTAKEVSEEEKWEKEDKDDITSNYGQEDIEKQILKNVTSKHLSMDELVAQCVIFFIAGYHTTAATLAFATHSLALNPDIQDKLRKEVDDVLKQHQDEMTYEAIQSMKYLDNVIAETLRLYPPTIRLERIATFDYELGDTGITIPKGMIVSIPIYAMHRDPEFYLDPEKFDPDRFTAEERGNREPYTYLPFGAGPRNCVGMRFALMEVKVCLAYVIANFIIKKCPDTKVPIKFLIGEGILKSNDIIVEMEIRKDCPKIK